MDPIFEAYVNCFVEKAPDSDDLTIYITCKLSKTLHEQWKGLVTNLDEADAVEKEPHCTFLFAKLEQDVNPDILFKLVKEEVEGLNFELCPMGFKVFEDVSDGEQDCLVVMLDAPGDVTQIQSQLCNKLIAHGVKLVQEHPVWKPHMTIAYFPKDTAIKYSHPVNGMLNIPIKAQVDFMKVNSGKEMELTP